MSNFTYIFVFPAKIFNYSYFDSDINYNLISKNGADKYTLAIIIFCQK